MASKTKVLKAPYGRDGSLLHHPSDGWGFSHYEDPKTGERLERSQIWEPVTVPPEMGSGFPSVDRKIRDFKVVSHQPEWRDNLPFHAMLQIDHIRTGRSAKYIILKPYNSPLDQRTWPMFVSDLIDAACLGRILMEGVIQGPFMVAKRGENYGLRLAKEGE